MQVDNSFNTGAAYQLHVVWSHAQYALGRLPDDSKGLDEQAVEWGAASEAGSKVGGVGGELLVGEGCHWLLEGVDEPQLLDVALQEAALAWGHGGEQLLPVGWHVRGGLRMLMIVCHECMRARWGVPW